MSIEKGGCINGWGLSEVFPKLVGLMASEPVVVITQGRILKVVLVVGVLAFVFFKELIDDGVDEPGRMI